MINRVKHTEIGVDEAAIQYIDQLGQKFTLVITLEKPDFQASVTA
jgi:Asp/Glu/hydantoin racemase